MHPEQNQTAIGVEADEKRRVRSRRTRLAQLETSTGHSRIRRSITRCLVGGWLVWSCVRAKVEANLQAPWRARGLSGRWKRAV